MPTPADIDLVEECRRLLLRQTVRSASRLYLPPAVVREFFGPVPSAAVPSAVPRAPVDAVRPSVPPPRAAAAPPPPPEPVREWGPERLPPPAASAAGVLAVPPAGLPLANPGLPVASDWDGLAGQVAACQRCPLCQGRTRTVFGEGDRRARLMFIGEGPGEEEDRQGRPFVGRAGEFLTKMIAAMGLSRDQVYIANIVKCRPPQNRTPHQEEVSACLPYLERQVQLLAPAAIVTLGNVPLQALFHEAGIVRLRGHWREYRGIPVMPTYHPSYIIRMEGMAAEREKKREVWNDLQEVMRRLGLPPPAKKA